MSDRVRRDADDQASETDGDHLTDLPDGSGCTEIWEHLSARRATEEE